MHQYVLIVAGGKGERAQTSVPKQFIALMETFVDAYNGGLFE